MIEIKFSDYRAKTLADWTSDVNSIAYGYNGKIASLLQLKGESGISNRESILNSYTPSQKKKYQTLSPSSWLLKIGTPLVLEPTNVNRSAALTEGIEVISNNTGLFKAAALARLEADDAYTPKYKIEPLLDKQEYGTLQKENPDLTVWIWCRALSSANNNYLGQIFNITPFVTSVKTQQSKAGGTFELQVAPIMCILKDEIWTVTQEFLEQGPNGYRAKANIGKDSQFLFHSIISENDVVWIRYEPLVIEPDEDIEGAAVSPDSIPGRIYDMIGLVDTNQIGINMQINTQSVDTSISGRDLSKLFIEDGTYFFYTELMQGALGTPGSATEKSALSKRLLVDNSQFYLSLFYNNTIDKIFQFVIQQLSTIEIVPTELFAAYGDRRNQRLIDKKQDNYFKWQGDLDNLYSKAVKEISTIREFNDISLPDSIGERKFAHVIFTQKKRFLKTIRGNGARITSGAAIVQTDGWNAFSFINERGVAEPIGDSTWPTFFNDNLYQVRETRVTLESSRLVQYIDAIIDIEDGQARNKNDKELRSDVAAGIWQIIKLVIDETVLKRTVIDSSLSSANGSLINFFNKVCQTPFVEFLMDTYGDTYNILIRKPPTDKQSILDALNSTVKTDEGEFKSGIIDINADDVVVEQLSYSNESYSWYHFIPQANFYGSASNYTLAYLPAIYFPEYASIWGSKPLQLNHNYLPAFDSADSEGLDIVFKQAVEDLRFVIESHAYLPFTRQGSLTLRRDRRLKVGNFIRYTPTGEIFHIDSVQQDHSISEKSVSRTTTIRVSRGMIEQLIYGVQRVNSRTGVVDSETPISYFNIINTKFKQPTYNKAKVKKTTRKKVGEKIVQKGKQTISNSTIPNSLVNRTVNQNLHILEELPEASRQRMIQLINAINAIGYGVIIVSGKRSSDQQFALWKKNSNNARPGHSSHEKGDAIDINIINLVTKRQYFKSTSSTEWVLTGVPQAATLLGFKWGGNAFSKYYDPVHFEYSSSQESDIVEDVYEDVVEYDEISSVDVSKLFEDIKVNKDVFNFFLRRQQFALEYRTPIASANVIITPR